MHEWSVEFWKGFMVSKLIGLKTNKRVWDAFESEDLHYVSKVDILQERKWKSRCTSDKCPQKEHMQTNRRIVLRSM